MRELNRREHVLAIVAGLMLFAVLGSRIIRYVNELEAERHELIEVNRELIARIEDGGTLVHGDKREIERSIDDLTEGISGLHRVELSGGDGSMRLTFSGSASAIWTLLTRLREISGIRTDGFFLSSTASAIEGAVQLEVEP